MGRPEMVQVDGMEGIRHAALQDISLEMEEGKTLGLSCPDLGGTVPESGPGIKYRLMCPFASSSCNGTVIL
jgi:hypothetical protein